MIQSRSILRQGADGGRQAEEMQQESIDIGTSFVARVEIRHGGTPMQNDLGEWSETTR